MPSTHIVPPGAGTRWQVVGESVTCKADLELVDRHLQVFAIDGLRDVGPPPHAHPWDEIFVIVDGELELRVGDDTEVVGAGWVGIVPAGTPHSFRTTSETSRFLAISSTNLAAAFFADMHENAAAFPPDPAAVVPIAIRHGLTPA